MKPVFERLLWFEDLQPRGGPENMAMDEVLWERCARENTALLRVYRWDPGWISFGYFQRWTEIAEGLPPGSAAVRRSTGGGTVDHRSGQTYSLLLPPGHRWTAGRAAEAYTGIHGSLAKALEAEGIHVALIETTPPPHPAGGWCFADPPVPGDLVLHGRKVAGAAQRRGRWGLLHQGHLALTTPIWEALAFSLAAEVTPTLARREEEAAAASLAREKYGAPGWLTKR